jgi:hypothetical protein
MQPLKHFGIRTDKYSKSSIQTPNPKLIIINNKDDKGRVLTYSVVDQESPMNKDDFKEFNTLQEAKAYARKYK